MYSIIPLQAQPNRSFSCSIPVDDENISLNFSMSYNDFAGYWSMTISRSSDDMLIRNLPIIPGDNILGQFEYMRIGSAFVVPRQSVEEQWPGYNTLTSDWYLIWGDNIGG